MKYSLLSRFQGCFEGMVAADDWRYGVTQQSRLAARSGQAFPWMDLAVRVTEALILANNWPPQAMPLDITQLCVSGVNHGPLAIATLPVALFFHDDLLLQQQHLRQTVQTWGGTASMADWVTVFGYAIAQALKEHLEPSQFLAHLLSYWNSADPDLQPRSPQMQPSLEVLHSLVDQGASARTAILALDKQLPQEEKTIALALYCFLSTPDSWHLSVRHAARLFPDHPALCALTGCLAGAYNSSSGLPLAWKVASLQTSATSSSPPPIQIQGRELATRLFATWSGMFDASHRLASHTLSVASPGIAYSRS